MKCFTGLGKIVGHRKNNRQQQGCVSENVEIGPTMEHRSATDRFGC